MKEKTEIDIQGHRGCRGLYPENTLPAFGHALNLGVTTLEMDVVITADHKVIVSHEPFFNPEISLTPSGDLISKDSMYNHNIYKLDYNQVKQYDVGLKPHPRFPEQVKIACYKPLLAKVFELAIEHSKTHQKPIPYFNIEIKSKDGQDGIFHPKVDKFVDLTVGVIDSFELRDYVSIQSFDIRTLHYLHGAYPDIKSVYLVENDDSFSENLSKLNFIPDIYSPYFKVVDEDLIIKAQELNIAIIPWTVNTVSDMEKMIKLGVDGIITDYPNVLLDLIKKY